LSTRGGCRIWPGRVTSLVVIIWMFSRGDGGHDGQNDQTLLTYGLHSGARLGRASSLRNKMVTWILYVAGGPDSGIRPLARGVDLLIMAAEEGPTPTAEEKNSIMSAKKELIQALIKRRALDKQLVR
jgi:hypothetical protein